MTINRLFDWLVFAQVVAIVAMAALFVHSGDRSYESDLTALFARHGEIYGAEVSGQMAFLGLLILLSVPISLYGVWRRRRWGALLYGLIYVAVTAVMISWPDTVMVSSVAEYFLDMVLNWLSIFLVAFILLRREELGFPPFIRGKASL